MVQFAHLGYSWIFGLVILVIVLLFYSVKRRKLAIRAFAGKELANKMLDGYHPRLRKMKTYLLVASLIFFSIALIGPKVGMKLTKIKRKGIDIAIAFDISLSMNAQDVSPSRLERAKYEAGKFIDRLQGDRVGLVAFAGISYLQCPLTLDYSAAKLFLEAIDSDAIGTQGTAIAEAISTSMGAFKGDVKKYKTIIIISDGEDHEGDISSILDRVVEEGVIIYSVGVGTFAGAPIPYKDKEKGEVLFKRDRSNRVVTTSLKENTLQELAVQSGGKYYNMQNDSRVFQKIYNDIFKMEKKELQSHKYSDYKERYQIFLVIGLILFLIELFIPEKTKKQKQPAKY